MVRPKKYLGQHFLRNDAICKQVAEYLQHHRGYSELLEIGPGTGALTKHLLNDKRFELSVVEVDLESADYLKLNFPQLKKIIVRNFLKLDLANFFACQQIGIAGNFPYNISSQILFHVLEHRNYVTEVVGMFQREVAMRIAGSAGTKEYGILSVLVQAFYKVEYLMTVEPHEFFPPPNVKSGLLRLTRNDVIELPCDEKKFFMVVKMAFNQRRKTLRNSLSAMLTVRVDKSLPIFTMRREQLSVDQFIQLTLLLSE